MKIDGLKLPNDISVVAEKQNFDSSKRAVSGRLITKLAPTEKWKLTISFENITLSLPLQKAFYEKCMAMRNKAAVVEFINPYTGMMERATMRCVSRVSPQPSQILRRSPSLYRNVGAVFEEV